MFVRTIEPSEAEGEIASIYNDEMASMGRVMEAKGRRMYYFHLLICREANRAYGRGKGSRQAPSESPSL